uniref:Uncharacterized protein n=1 Tax=Romanomermis culicivorax TaxID=13658 RepID=A0A915HPE3_ROMCU
MTFNYEKDVWSQRVRQIEICLDLFNAFSILVWYILVFLKLKSKRKQITDQNIASGRRYVRGAKVRRAQSKTFKKNHYLTVCAKVRRALSLQNSDWLSDCMMFGQEFCCASPYEKNLMCNKQ